MPPRSLDHVHVYGRGTGQVCAAEDLTSWACAQKAEERVAEAEAAGRKAQEENARLQDHIHDLETRKRAPLYQKKQEEELRAATEKAKEAEGRALEAEARAKEAKVVVRDNLLFCRAFLLFPSGLALVFVTQPLTPATSQGEPPGCAPH